MKYVLGMPMSELGQNAKYSKRADVFRFAPNFRHYLMQSALRIGAQPGSGGHLCAKTSPEGGSQFNLD